jgi:diacylglycerol kinase
MKPQRSASVLLSFKYASAGILHTIRSQRNFRIHLVATTLVVAVGAWLGLSLEAWAILSLIVGLVLVTEIVNTAAETLVDLASPDYHPLAKQVKDLVAGAVLVVAVVSVIVGLLILGPPLLAKLGWLPPS